MSTTDPTKYAEAESHFVDSRVDSWKGSTRTTNVWRFHVVVDWTRWDGPRREMTIDVWSPRYECTGSPRYECTDADEETGWPIYGWEYDRLSNAETGEELSDEDHDDFADAVRELLRESDFG